MSSYLYMENIFLLQLYRKTQVFSNISKPLKEES